MKLKGNLHTHTIFSDGQKTIEELIVIYKSLGYDFIAITDHDFMVGEEYYKALGKINEDDFLVFSGLEITEDLLNGQHVGCIEGEKEKLHILNHPSLYSLSIKDILFAIEIIKSKYTIDCIDVSHYGTYTPQYDIDAIPLPKVASDDSHRNGMFGNAWIEVNSKMNKDDIIRNVKKGNFVKRFKK